MLQKNKMLYGLLILFVGFTMSFNSATAQVTGEDMESQSQNAFTGLVVDATTGQPVANATVKIEGTDKETTTDENGKFTFENLMMSGNQGETGGQQEVGQTGGMTIVINAEGYEELSEQIQPGQQGQQQQGQPKTFELQPKQGEGYQ